MRHAHPDTSLHQPATCPRPFPSSAPHLVGDGGGSRVLHPPGVCLPLLLGQGRQHPPAAPAAALLPRLLLRSPAPARPPGPLVLLLTAPGPLVLLLTAPGPLVLLLAAPGPLVLVLTVVGAGWAARGGS